MAVRAAQRRHVQNLIGDLVAQRAITETTQRILLTSSPVPTATTSPNSAGMQTTRSVPAPVGQPARLPANTSDTELASVVAQDRAPVRDQRLSESQCD